MRATRLLVAPSSFRRFEGGGMKTLAKILIGTSLTLLLTACTTSAGSSRTPDRDEGDRWVPTTIVGFHHLGNKFSIPEFYLNDGWAGNLGRDKGGGGHLCCVKLPIKWKPHLTAEVRWRVIEWSNEQGNRFAYKSEKAYVAKVPIEKYDDLGDLYIHFFPSGRVRIIPSMYSPLSPFHSFISIPDDGGPTATKGTTIPQASLKDRQDEVLGQ